MSPRSRRAATAIAVVAVLGGLVGCAPEAPAPAPTADAEREMLAELIAASAERNSARGVIAQVARGDEVLVSTGWGQSMAGVPVTAEMHFRNGAMAIPQVTTVLLQLVDEGAVALEDPLSDWLAAIPNSERVTLGQLAQMTAGYADYVTQPEFAAASDADPFRSWTPEQLVAYGTEQPLVYEPGTNWNYSHTDVVLLGLALERITGQSLSGLISERILDPLGMAETAAPGTPEIRSPVLHSYTPERRGTLGIAEGVPFTEDATFWDPSWTLARGAVQYSTAADMSTLMRAIGRGDLLSDTMHELQLAPTLRGATTAVEGCATCFAQSRAYTFGYGVVLTGDWIVQNPQFAGLSGVAGYLPERDLTIVVAATASDAGFDAAGNPTGHPATDVFVDIAEVLAPGTAVHASS